ncbi:hypothetical protein [Vannielia litorea]|uniref:hypothetical protein n=1 Tax=Vannielia litorea TaxID=1217970 RepID=UPI001C971971|nr:hypothetical protein [Vannielia litorea]MBY6048859.1 hypothetical protein [Vannielia litorea]MBY6076273.1 hypothetical protein [Vannielia litorea]
MSVKRKQMQRLSGLMEARFMAGQGTLKQRLAEEARLAAAIDEIDNARRQAMADASDPVHFSPSHARATNVWLRWTDARKAVLNRDLARARAASAKARKALARSFGQMQASRELIRKL